MPIRGNELKSQQGHEDMCSVAHIFLYCCIDSILTAINKHVYQLKVKRKIQKQNS